MSLATRTRVQVAAEQLGFRPNALARGLRARWTHTVGVIVHDITDSYFAEIARGVADTALDASFLTIICNTDRAADEELRYVGMLAESRVAGVLFVGGGLKDRDYRLRLEETVRDIRAYGGHVVALGPRYEHWPGEVPDNRNGARLAAEHLLSLGHRNIAMISGPSFLRTTDERDAGFFRALQAAGVEPDPALQVNADFTREGGAGAMELLLERGKPFTAVFAANDAMAIGCLHVLRERGIRVPEDLSLVGFDDIPVAAYLSPPLTTVVLEMRQIGMSGMRRLQALIAGTDRGARTRAHPARLAVRESTAPVRARRRREESA